MVVKPIFPLHRFQLFSVYKSLKLTQHSSGDDDNDSDTIPVLIIIMILS